MDSLDEKLELYTDRSLINYLHQKGWSSSRSSNYRDRKAIQRTNTWVQDLGETTYSARQEHIDDIIAYTLREAKEMYQKEWIVKKAISRKTPQGDTVIAETQAEIPGAKNMFLRTIQTGAELLMKHTNGENINRSVAMLAQELEDSSITIEKLKSKLLEKGEDVEKILHAQEQSNTV